MYLKRDEVNEKNIEAAMRQTHESGYLHYEDAYEYADYFIEKTNRKICEFIRLRFPYVFIDEMQDCSGLQVELIKKLFKDDLKSSCVLQCIGDNNQAIFNGFENSESTWEPNNALPMNNSMRFSQVIANVLNTVALKSKEIRGNEDREKIPPVLILYPKDKIKDVINRFGELIQERELHKKDAPIFKAVGWKKENQKGEEEQRGVKDYFENFSKTSDSELRTPADYVAAACKDRALGKNIKDVIERLRKAIEIALNEAFTKNLSFEKWKEEMETLANINLEIANWLRKDEQKMSDEIKNYIQKITKTDKELFHGSKKSNNKNEAYANQYTYNPDSSKILISVDTVHGVKGETHTATLYLETYNRIDKKKCPVYDIKGLIKKGFFREVGNTAGVKQELKIAHVALSRPSHFLCVAISVESESDLCVKKLEDMGFNKENGWEIDDVLAPKSK